MRPNRHFPGDPQHHTAGARPARISAGRLLVALRRHHIPCSIDSMSASGWTARLGDPTQGRYSQQGCFPTRDAAAAWLLEEAERRGAAVLSVAAWSDAAETNRTRPTSDPPAAV
jgi:hypothetical protein